MTQMTKFERLALADIDNISRTMTMGEVVARFAKHLSFCPETVSRIAHYWMRPLVVKFGQNSSGSESIAGEFASIFTAVLSSPISLEARTESGATPHATFFLFGTDQSRFSLPFALLRYNHVSAACALRFIAQGHVSAATDAMRAFGDRQTSVTNSVVEYGEFRYNQTLSLHWSRMPIVCAIAVYLAATAQRAAAENGHEEAEQDRATPDTYMRGARVIMLDALQKVEPRLQARNLPWIDETEMATFDALRNACRTDATFNAHNIEQVLAIHYTKLARYRAKMQSPATEASERRSKKRAMGATA